MSANPRKELHRFIDDLHIAERGMSILPGGNEERDILSLKIFAKSWNLAARTALNLARTGVGRVAVRKWSLGLVGYDTTLTVSFPREFLHLATVVVASSILAVITFCTF